MALESGEIDLIFGKNMIDADAISQYLDSDRFTVGLSDPTSTRHIVMNTTREILGDPAVRKALQHATDRQTSRMASSTVWSSPRIRFTPPRSPTAMSA